MTLNPSDIVAAAPTAAAPTAATGQIKPGTLLEPLVPKDEAQAQIPDAVLALPTFRPLLEGKPPAIKITLDEFNADPEAQTIQQNIQPLLYSGFGVYQPKDGQSAVLFNGQFIDGETLKLADEKGKLDQVAAPYGELKSFFADNLGEAVVDGAPAPAAPVAPSPAGQPMGAAAPASAQTKLASARIKNLAVGSPTSGPTPGSGRVLNNILKPTI